jgi:hypothetical protein
MTGAQSAAPVRERPHYRWLYAIGLAGAIAIGAAADHLYAVAIAALTLAPLVAHAAHVGPRNALSEPNAITVIVLFYLLVFPLRALVVVLTGYTDLVVVRRAVTANELVSVLLLASASTTTLVEAYYFVIRRRGNKISVVRPSATEHEAVVKLTFLLVGVSLASLAGLIAEHGGISGARATFLPHTAAWASESTNGTMASIWDVFSIPTLWCCAYGGLYPGTSRRNRFVFLGSSLVILAGALLIFGSRLDAVLGLIGAWIVYRYSGRRLPAPLVLAALALAVVLSQPLLSARAGTAVQARQSSLERYSRISGYGILDVTLAVWSEPQEVRKQDTARSRWLDLPEYFVPSALWPGRPNLASRRLDAYVAQDVGAENDKTAGFPATYITEAWLIGGWPGALIFSALFGASLGWLSRRLVRSIPASPVALLTYAFVATAAWTYYKDGDLLATFVGQVHRAIYFLPLLWIARTVVAKRTRAGRSAPLSRPHPGAPAPAS